MGRVANMAILVNNISLDDLSSFGDAVIYYAVSTCWWTHDPDDLHKHRGCGLPCDPRGSMLMEVSRASEFIGAAESNMGHYGEYALLAFISAHAKNCLVSPVDFRHTSLESWSKYNAQLKVQGGTLIEPGREKMCPPRKYG
jgi:hypothetical protein